MKKHLLFYVLAIILAVSSIPAVRASSANWTEETRSRYDYIDDWDNLFNDKNPEDFLCPVADKDGKWGFIDSTGREIVAPAYDNTSYVRNGVGCVEKDGKWGFVDKSGKLVIPVLYDAGSYRFSDEAMALQKKGKWGYVDFSGRELCEFVFDALGTFSDGMGMAIKDNKMGFVSAQGGLAIPLKYDLSVDEYGFCEYYAQFSEGCAAVQQGGKWGYIRKDGSTAIPFVYDDAKNFGEGLAPVRKDGFWGYVDERGREQLPFIYGEAEPFSGGEASVILDSLTGYIDKAGQNIRGFEFQEVKSFTSYDGDHTEFLNDYMMAKKDDKWGIVTADLKTVTVPYAYDSIDFNRNFSRKHLRARLNGKYGYIDFAGNVVFPFVITVEQIPSEGLFGYRTDEGWGFMDMRQNTSIGAKYRDVRKFCGGFAAVMTGDGWGFIDKAGNEIVTPQYDDALDFSEGLAAVKRDGLWGFVDSNGTQAINCTLDGAGSFYNGRAAIKSGQPDFIRTDTDTVYYIDRKGNAVTEPVIYEQYEEEVKARWAEGTGESPLMGPSRLYGDRNDPLTREDCCAMLSWLYYPLAGDWLPYPKTSPFTDTDDVDVRQCIEAGLIDDWGVGLFWPDESVTRQDFAVMMARLLLKLDTGRELKGDAPIMFEDADNIADYAVSAVDYLSSLGIISGTDGLFNPKGLITREQASDIVVRAHDVYLGSSVWLW